MCSSATFAPAEDLLMLKDVRPPGKIACLTIGIAVGAVVGSLVVLSVGHLGRGQPELVVRIIGADISRHGGSQVIVADERGNSIRQVCSERCDDLRATARSTDNAVKVQVLDAGGHCILCSGGQYVTSGAVTEVEISGAQSLKLSSAVATH
jgi:gas vesicle protein